MASVVSSNANGVNIGYAYDVLNRLQTVTDNGLANATTYTYDNVGNLATVLYPNGVLHSYNYDPKDQLLGLQVGKVPGIFASYTQTFGDAGHKLTVAELNGRSETYGYDFGYRLLSETVNGAPSNGLLKYTLDPVGNRMALTSTLAELQSQTATFGADDRISGDKFDNNGSTLTSNGVTYGYEFEDRLVSTSSGMQITYDGDGNRVSETVDGVATKFMIDEHNPSGWPQVAEEVVGGAVTAQYTHGFMHISQNRGGTVSYYGYDGGGSVRQLLNLTGAVTDTYAYDAFGNTLARTGSTVNPYQYRGEQFEGALQMYYLRARYYVPKTGRFLTQDTEVGVLGRPVTQHKYVYAYDDPLGFNDPSGHGFFERAQLTVLAVLASPVVQQSGEAARGWISLAMSSWLRANQYYDIFFENATTWGEIIRGTRNVVASGQFLDTAGNVIRATAVSGNRWIPELEEAVEDAGEVPVRIPWNELVDGAHHAEQLLLQWAEQNNYRILSIAAAGQQICGMCEPVLRQASDAQRAAYGFGFPFIP